MEHPDSMPCPGKDSQLHDIGLGGHTTIKLYRRPWRKFFRKELFRKCFGCDQEFPG